MHPWQFVASFDDLCFLGRKFFETLPDGIFGCKGFRQPDVRRVMTGFGFEEAFVELGQLLVRHMVAEQTESFARTSFDQAGDQQSIDAAVRFELADQVVELPAVVAGFLTAKRDVALVEQLQYLVEMVQLLIDDDGHFAAQFFVFHVGHQQVHRTAGRLSLAMGVVQQNLVQVLVDLSQPAVGGCRVEIEHLEEEMHGVSKKHESAEQYKMILFHGPDVLD